MTVSPLTFGYKIHHQSYETFCCFVPDYLFFVNVLFVCFLFGHSHFFVFLYISISDLAIIKSTPLNTTEGKMFQYSLERIYNRVPLHDF